MNKKKKTVLTVIIFLLLLFFVTSITTDSIRASKNNKPIFAIKIASYDDGGSEKYSGLFYSVYHVKEMTEEDILDHGYYIRTWFTSIDKVKNSLK